MSNPFRAEVTIEIGGKTRRLRFDNNAVAELEAALDMPVTKMFDEEHMGIRVVRQALHVGLRGGGLKTGSIRQIGRWMDATPENPKPLETYAPIVAKALFLALGIDIVEDGDDGVVDDDETVPEDGVIEGGKLDETPLELKAAVAGG